MVCWLRNYTGRGGEGDNSNRIGGDGWLGRGLEERQKKDGGWPNKYDDCHIELQGNGTHAFLLPEKVSESRNENRRAVVFLGIPAVKGRATLAASYGGSQGSARFWQVGCRKQRPNPGKQQPVCHLLVKKSKPFVTIETDLKTATQTSDELATDANCSFSSLAASPRSAVTPVNCEQL